MMKKKEEKVSQNATTNNEGSALEKCIKFKSLDERIICYTYTRINFKLMLWWVFVASSLAFCVCVCREQFHWKHSLSWAELHPFDQKKIESCFFFLFSRNSQTIDSPWEKSKATHSQGMNRCEWMFASIIWLEMLVFSYLWLNDLSTSTWQKRLSRLKCYIPAAGGDRKKSGQMKKTHSHTTEECEVRERRPLQLNNTCDVSNFPIQHTMKNNYKSITWTFVVNIITFMAVIANDDAMFYNVVCSVIKISFHDTKCRETAATAASTRDDVTNKHTYAPVIRHIAPFVFGWVMSWLLLKERSIFISVRFHFHAHAHARRASFYEWMKENYMAIDLVRIDDTLFASVS